MHQGTFEKVVHEIKKRGSSVAGLIIGDVITDADREYKTGIISYIHDHEMESDIYMPGFRRDVEDIYFAAKLKKMEVPDFLVVAALLLDLRHDDRRDLILGDGHSGLLGFCLLAGILIPRQRVCRGIREIGICRVLVHFLCRGRIFCGRRFLSICRGGFLHCRSLRNFRLAAALDRLLARMRDFDRLGSLSEGQVLACPYPYDKARIIVQEMTDSLVS